MIRRARNILNNGSLYGLLLTAMVLSMQHAGALENLEHWFYDQRIKYFQFFNPPPTDRLVHLDIDDAVMESVGAWPWPRSKLAEMIDEIGAARPRSIAMDIIFTDPATVRWVPRGDGKFEAIDDDQVFAAALRRAGCALIGTSLPFVPSQPPNVLHEAVRAALVEDLELNQAEVAAKLRKQGNADRGLDEQVAREFLAARREAVYFCVRRELARSHTQSRSSARFC